jgi:serine/threonine-protein kinase RsbW
LADRSPLVRVSVPARPDFVHVLRAVVSSVASRLEMSFDLVEEVRIAVDEASTMLLEVADAGAVLELAIEPQEHALVATLTAASDTDGWPDDAVKTSWPWRVMTGLCDEVALERSPGGPAIRFVKRGGAWTS